MALIFEYEKDINTGTQPFMSHEEDSTIYNYFISEEKALDRSAFAENGYYDDITFDNEERHLTTKAVSKIGVKNFPGIGGIGFFKDAYTEDSRIVAPIHSNQAKQEAPVLQTAEIVDGKFHVVINPPTDLKYTCYRVIARQKYFAFEYITYKNDYYVDIPTVRGEYTVYCIGYDEDNGTVSEDSNELALTVPDGNDDWAPHFQEVGDLIVQIGVAEDKVDSMQQDIDDLNNRLDNLTVSAAVGTVSLINSQYISSTGASSYSRSYTGTVGNILLLLVLTRGELSVAPAGWTKIGSLVESKDKEIGSVTYNQYVHVLYKECTGTEEFSYTQAESSLSITCILEFAGATVPSIEEYTRQENVIATTPLTFSRLSNDFFVWVTMAVYFLNDTYVWQVSDSSILQLPNNGTVKPRMGVFVDDREVRDSFTVSSGLNDKRYCSGLGIKIPAQSLQSQIDALEDRVDTLEETLDSVEELVDEINGEVV